MSPVFCKHFFYTLVFLVGLRFSIFASTQGADLTLQDVPRVMETIFQEHITQKNMTRDLVVRGIKHFIDQFDPHRIYLLASETDQFLHPTKKTIDLVVQEYKGKKFIFFGEMNSAFQKAIQRARTFRKKWKYMSFQDAEALLATSEASPIKDDDASFSRTVEELESKAALYMARLLVRKQKNNISFEEAQEQIEEQMKEHENEYLYTDKSGAPLPSQARENLFALHILKAFTESLDAHSAFLDPKESDLLRARLQKESNGVVITEGRVDSSSVPIAGGIIGKISLHSFYEGEEDVSSVQDVALALATLAKKGPLKGVVLDLRDNRGGFLMQAVKVAGLFIKSGVVVISKTRDGKEHFYRDIDSSISFQGPLIILTSKATASAAEIVAQALKDYGVALIVGDEKTYGKGSIQMQTATSKASDPSFKVTVGQYYSVSGQSIQMIGVKADIVVPSFLFNQRLGEEFLQAPLKQDSVSSAFKDSLSDVDPDMKGWYMQYYLPCLEGPKRPFEKYVPELRRRSEERLLANREYQRFLHGLPITKTQKKGNALEVVVLTPEQAERRVEALQMQEAVNILKDLIELSSSASAASSTMKLN